MEAPASVSQPSHPGFVPALSGKLEEQLGGQRDWNRANYGA